MSEHDRGCRVREPFFVPAPRMAPVRGLSPDGRVLPDAAGENRIATSPTKLEWGQAAGRLRFESVIQFTLFARDRAPRVIAIGEVVFKIGADPRCDVVIDDEDAAWMHAVIEVSEESGATIIDLGTKHGTLVNGKPINRCRLQVGDEIAVGAAVLRVDRVVVPREERE